MYTHTHTLCECYSGLSGMEIQWVTGYSSVLVTLKEQFILVITTDVNDYRIAGAHTNTETTEKSVTPV